MLGRSLPAPVATTSAASAETRSRSSPWRNATDLAIAGFTRQWTVGTEPRPYRYGGAVGPAHFDAKAEARMIATAEAVSSALGLVGLVSFDFLLADGLSFLA